jgi:adenylate cyclase
MKQPVQRRLAAILAADVAGYSRLMGADEEGTLTRLKAHRRHIMDPKIREHNARIVKSTGDGLLVEFPSVVDAVRCAAEIQRLMVHREAEMADDARIRFRIGINLGDIIVDGADIFGDGVNVAARLEGLAEPGGICISRVVRDQIRGKLLYPFEDMGEQSVKNIARPVRTYAMTAVGVALLPPVLTPQRERPTRQRPRPQPDIPRLSIVVLPFTNLSNDPEQEYFADGITDDLTTDLSRISGSFVIARNTAFTCKGKSADVKQIGREVGVRYILEGSVRRTGDQVRVNVQLIDAETGAHIWADRLETNRPNLLEAQSEITGRLARTLGLELLDSVGCRIEHEKLADPNARDLIMRGWAIYNRPYSMASRQEALQLFEWALEIDIGSVDARVGIARILAANLVDGWSGTPQPDMTRAEQLLSEALEINPNLSVAHEAMGMLRRVQNRFGESQIEFETATALDPNNARAFHHIGQGLMYLGRPEAGIPQIEKAIRLNPQDPNSGHMLGALGMCHLLLGDVDQAIDLITKARARNPRSWFLHLYLAGALGFSGHVDGAKAALAESIKLKPEVNSLKLLLAKMWWWGHPEHLTLAENVPPHIWIRCVL